jgi:hypothetical protein
VDEFATQFSLQEILPLLRKGALVAQRPEHYEDLSDLDETEKLALRNEILHKWQQPRALYLTVILCSVGAAVQ